MKLDKEEKEILKAYNIGKFQSIINLIEMIKAAEKAAQVFIEKTLNNRHCFVTHYVRSSQ